MEELRMYNRERQGGLSIEEREQEVERILARLQRTAPREEAPRQPLLYNAHREDIWEVPLIASFLIGQKSNRQRLLLATPSMGKHQIVLLHKRPSYMGMSYGSISGGSLILPLGLSLEEGDILEISFVDDPEKPTSVTLTLECYP